MSESNMAWQHQADCPKPTTVDGVFTCDCAWRWREQHPVAPTDADRLREVDGMLKALRKAKPAARALVRTTLVNALAKPMLDIEHSAEAWAGDAAASAPYREAHEIRLAVRAGGARVKPASDVVREEIAAFKLEQRERERAFYDTLLGFTIPIIARGDVDDVVAEPEHMLRTLAAQERAKP